MFAQDRLVAMEATLAGTIAHMQEMQLQKEELQQMLQQAQVSMYSLSAATCCLKTGNNRSHCHCSTSSGSVLQSRESAGRESASSTDVDCGLPISISLEGKQRQLSAEEIACMPVQEFATLWTVSVFANLAMAGILPHAASSLVGSLALGHPLLVVPESTSYCFRA